MLQRLLRARSRICVRALSRFAALDAIEGLGSAIATVPIASPESADLVVRSASARLHRRGAKQIDAAVAVAVALDCAEHVEEPVWLLGWL